MSGGQTILLLAILGACVIAEPTNSSEDTGPPYHQSPMDHHDHNRANFFQNLTQMFGSNGSDPFSQIANVFGQFIPGFGGSERSQPVGVPSDMIAESGIEDASPQDRFFFSVINHAHSVPIGCNYTEQAGYSCSGCREQLLCNTNNVGRIRICPFFAPYCYNGVCGTYVNATCTNSTG